MEDFKNNKIERVLGIYTKLMNGYLVSKAEESVNYGVNERSIQRDIDDIRNYLGIDGEREGCINSVIYDRISKGYRLEVEVKRKENVMYSRKYADYTVTIHEDLIPDTVEIMRKI